MPVVEISAGAWTNFANRITNFTGISPATGGGVSTAYKGSPLLVDNSPQIVSVIRIYSGTRQSAWMGTTTSADAGLLIQFVASTNYSSIIGPVTYTVTGTSPLTTTTQIITGLKAATATGTASWFLLGVVNGGTGAPGTTLYQQITGTVGVLGSGADLIISDTSIIAGQLYKVVDLTFTFSSVFTY